MKEIYHIGKIDWEDIPVGDVFALNACWSIMIKTGERTARLIDCDDVCHEVEFIFDEFKLKSVDWRENLFYFFPKIYALLGYREFASELLYKLPLKVQRNWRCDR